MNQGQLPFPPKPSGIHERFCAEQQEIQRYVEVVRARLQFTEPELMAIARVLEQTGLLDGPIPEVRQGSGIHSYREVIGALERSPGKYESKVEKALQEAKAKVEALGDPPRLEDGNWTAPVEEWVTWMAEQLRHDSSQGQIDCLRRDGLRSMQQTAHECSDDSLVEPEVIDFAISAGLYKLAVERVHHLAYVLDSLTQLATLRRIGSRQTAIHILRQGFILLMTALDGAVFDLVRAAMRNRFFPLIGRMAQQGKMSYSRLSNYTSFDCFREEIIEEQLRRRYLKDVLFFLDDMGVALTDETSGDTFGHLIELVLRRNVHIHNRGVVDQHYLSCPRGEQGPFNVYGLEIGQPAVIGSDYWVRANRLASNCVAATTRWAEAPVL
jgi:hypothetical protein